MLNSNEYFHKQSKTREWPVEHTPPYAQNQYEFKFGGPTSRQNFLLVNWGQFRLRTGSCNHRRAHCRFLERRFSSLLAQGIQLYDPYTVTANRARTPYANNKSPPPKIQYGCDSFVGQVLLSRRAGVVNLTNSDNARLQPAAAATRPVRDAYRSEYGEKTRIFGRFTYNGLLDLPRIHWNGLIRTVALRTTTRRRGSSTSTAFGSYLIET